MHLIENMLYLRAFWSNTEDVMGMPSSFCSMQPVCGVVGPIIDPEPIIPMIVASGVIPGDLGVYLMLRPRVRALVFIPIGLFSQMIYVSAAVALGLWFIMQVFSGGMSLGHEGGGVAFLPI